MNFDLCFVLLFYFSGLLGGVSLGYMLAGKWASPFVKPEPPKANNLPASTPPPMPERKTVEPYEPVYLRYHAGRPVNRRSLIRELQSRPNESVYLVEIPKHVGDLFDWNAEQEYQRKAAEQAFGIAAGMEAFRDFFNYGRWPQPGAKRSFPGDSTGPSFGHKSTEPEGYNG
ncbi:hypothetical protein CLV58_101197 [Spirosoma oryzae]|uniref:Uncharacterized protein n=1 Tax=Spirosoma oryzae TaxID=1469603 RepID=A0A2T0TND0_9BACT|nr:hypothetical protein [Spirosoma oryzae]PRY47131.1 hypothetical protein CLV58_101197 [Spirosoma oryzae]